MRHNGRDAGGSMTEHEIDVRTSHIEEEIITLVGKVALIKSRVKVLRAEKRVLQRIKNTLCERREEAARCEPPTT